MERISHIRRNSEGQIEAFQSNENHCKGVSELARKFANEFGMGDWGYAMGLLHDKGKEKHEFQEYIRDVNGITGHKDYTREGKAHAYIGGLIAKKLLKKESVLISNPIMGHHRGLYDYADLEEEEKKEIPSEVTMPDLAHFKATLPLWFSPEILMERDFHHIERMLYSCLVDADFLDTERFMQPEQTEKRKGKTPLNDLLPKLNDFLSRFGTPTTEVNKIRSEVQNLCIKEADGKPGFYSLTVPTGGGKTLSSLVWALHHAITNRKKRIIIAIPYTSIIVQTASVLRHIFGENNVLEHHSNFNFNEIKNENEREKIKLAAENWDYPIIVTTNVQLFESMFASRPSNCRKLHNICNSVLILDEVQTLPTHFLQPITDTLDTYKRIFGISVLFTTASQPVLEGNHQGTNPSAIFKGLSNIKEIIPRKANLHERLRRVTLDINNTPRTYDEVAEILKQHKRVLCIVNTRREAQELFDRLPDEGIKIHLSRMMCPAHVAEKIQEMKEALAHSGNKTIRVVSTQLIEAGVDIDFPVVFRQEAGLDSILQAAGRCNREGKLDMGITHVFSLAKERPLPPGHISHCNNARKNMVGEYDWFSPKAMNDYFIQLYSRVKSFDEKDMKYYLYDSRQLMPETAAKEFQLIDDATTSVIVNWKNSLKLIERLQTEGATYSLVKELSQYSVNLRKHDFDKMQKDGIIEEFVEGFYVAHSKSQYTEVGLLTENQWIEETWIV